MTLAAICGDHLRRDQQLEWPKPLTPWVPIREWARLTTGATVDEEHKVMVAGVEQTSVQPHGGENLLRGLLRPITSAFSRRAVV